LDYKKLVRSQSLRLKILKMLEFIPDKIMIKIQYFIKTGKRLNLKNPKRFNEKLQWYKLYYRHPLMTKCTDKYMVRKYVESKGLKEILVPLYGVYDSSHEIKFNELPQKFVLKTNNGGGSSTNIICTNKNNLHESDVKDKMNKWLNTRTPKPGREWAYYNIEPKIICETYLETNEHRGLVDYKFYCFNGEPHYLKIAYNDEVTGELLNGIFDMNFKQLPYHRISVNKINDFIEAPINFDKMKKIVKRLSEDFAHVRVDLYNINGSIYFGELTFYDTSGYQKFNKDEFDYILGDLFEL